VIPSILSSSRSRWAVRVVVLALALIGGASGAQAQKAIPDSGDLIRAGDAIRLKIWREPDLSGEFTINETGVVTLPKVGPMDVTNLTPKVLHDSLIGLYSVFLKDPSIEVTHLRRINILGAVKNPGSYTLDPTLTVDGALALAGGNTPTGKSNDFELRRDGKRIPLKVNASTQIAALPLRSGDQIFVPERSWVSRNGAVVLAALITASVAVGVAIYNNN
jgi:polysaccharide export outer membrane protein